MRPLRGAISCLVAVVVLAGCASTDITNRERYEGARLPEPDRIIVHDFTADPAAVPPYSTFADQLAAAPAPSPEQREAASRLGAQIATKLVVDLQGMGLPAVEAAGQPAPQINDIVLRGYLVSVDEGGAGRRVLVGFGSGAAELRTAVEAYQMTTEGLRPLARGETRSEGGKLPGMVLPAAVFAATASPIGLIVGGTAKATGEVTGSETIEGAAERTADEIAAQLKTAAEEQGWI
ncbi:MAG: DUF4410 domain-containing protein [Geminicoccaceae bacterium]